MDALACVFLEKSVLSVDGLPWKVHQQILADIRSILE